MKPSKHCQKIIMAVNNTSPYPILHHNQIITQSGSYLIPPHNGAIISIISAGGGGAGACLNDIRTLSSGGGGGGCGEMIYVNLTVSNSYLLVTITIGSPGLGGIGGVSSAAQNGTNAGDTTVTLSYFDIKEAKITGLYAHIHLEVVREEPRQMTQRLVVMVAMDSIRVVAPADIVLVVWGE